MRLKWVRFLGLAILLMLLASVAFAREGEGFYLAKLRQDPSLRRELETIVLHGLRRAYGETEKESFEPSDFFRKPISIFVTFRNVRGEVRGCMGSLYPSESSLQAEIFHKIELALFKDPRHRAVTREELKNMEVFITEVSRPVPIRSLSQLSPARDGVYLRQGHREAVLLPGEAKTQRYMLALLKAKAGVVAREPYQLYRLKSLTLSIKIKDV